ncbi:helix-turn-helix domain-containing protein [Tahibacter harae]|uniref:helix-turn-helix domain-containing protein n=1 Tax=Tahibacter harae TaxID=2963937 RepID=UPI0034E0D35F
MSTFEQILGGVIAAQRRKANLSQESLAALSGVHPTYISQLERGLKSPTIRVLQDIAKALGTSSSELLAMVGS